MSARRRLQLLPPFPLLPSLFPFFLGMKYNDGLTGQTVAMVAALPYSGEWDRFTCMYLCGFALFLIGYDGLRNSIVIHTLIGMDEHLDLGLNFDCSLWLKA